MLDQWNSLFNSLVGTIWGKLIYLLHNIQYFNVKHHNKYLNNQVKDNIWLEIEKKLGYNEDGVICWYAKEVDTTVNNCILRFRKNLLGLTDETKLNHRLYLLTLPQMYLHSGMFFYLIFGMKMIHCTVDNLHTIQCAYFSCSYYTITSQWWETAFSLLSSGAS